MDLRLARLHPPLPTPAHLVPGPPLSEAWTALPAHPASSPFSGPSGRSAAMPFFVRLSLTLGGGFDNSNTGENLYSSTGGTCRTRLPHWRVPYELDSSRRNGPSRALAQGRSQAKGAPAGQRAGGGGAPVRSGAPLESGPPRGPEDHSPGTTVSLRT